MPPSLTNHTNSHSTHVLAIFLFKKNIYHLFQNQSYRGWGELRWRKREREYEWASEWDIIHWLIHSPNGYNDQSWGDSKPGPKNIFQVSHMSTGIQGHSHGHINRNWIRSRHVRTWASVPWDFCTADKGLTYYVTMPIPPITSFSYKIYHMCKELKRGTDGLQIKIRKWKHHLPNFISSENRCWNST